MEYHDPFLRYREPANDFYGLYANSIGRYLYPLRKYETPFSQWAVFTDYVGYDMYGINLRSTMRYQFNPKLSTGLDLDFNYLGGYKREEYYQPPELSRKASFLYPFFEASLSYHPASNCTIAAVLGNKAMNLDFNYPTHYLLTHPVFGLRSFFNFE
jgi:hypothetical protein